MSSSADPARIDAYVWRISAVVIVGSIMSILDTTIVNVALATLGHRLHSPIAQIQWVVTGYMLALAAVIPITGWPLLDLRLYRRPTFASASFAMFCLGAALFGGMILLPLYRQGIRHETVLDTGLLTAPMGLGAALGRPLAGKLADRWGGAHWRCLAWS